MFLGEYTHTIDEKGRLTIPAKYRVELASGLVVTRGFDRNLMVYTKQGWEELAREIAEQPISNQEVREFRRRFFSGATDLVPDRQGRILVPPYLREFAGIEQEVVIAGMFNYLEIWNSSVWQSVRESAEDNGDSSRWQDLGF